MLPKTSSKTSTLVARLARRFSKDTRGVAAVEFAFVLPVLCVMLLGTVEVARAIDADRRFGNATAMTTDLIAREQDITDADLDGMMLSIEHMMKPYDADELKLGVIAVRAPITPGNPPVVEWSYSHKGKEVPAKCSNYTLPNGLVSPGSRVVIVESSYGFTPLFVNWQGKARLGTGPVQENMSGGLINWEDKATFTPRSDCVHNATHQSSASRCDFSCN